MDNLSVESRLEVISYESKMRRLDLKQLKLEYGKILKKYSATDSNIGTLKRINAEQLVIEKMQDDIRKLNKMSDIVAHCIAVKIVS